MFEARWRRPRRAGLKRRVFKKHTEYENCIFVGRGRYRLPEMTIQRLLVLDPAMFSAWHV